METESSSVNHRTSFSPSEVSHKFAIKVKNPTQLKILLPVIIVVFALIGVGLFFVLYNPFKKDVVERKSLEPQNQKSEDTTNPFEQLKKTNPFNIKTNPFE